MALPTQARRLLQRRAQAHSSANGAIDSSDGLVSAIAPHSNPHANQAGQSKSSSRSVSSSDQHQQERRERGLPGPAHRRPVEQRRQRPHPRRPSRDARSQHALRDEVDRNRRQRGKQAVESEQRDPRRVRVSPEHAKHAGDHVRIERRQPRRRSGVAVKGRAESVAFGDRARNAPDFVAEVPALLFRVGDRRHRRKQVRPGRKHHGDPHRQPAQHGPRQARRARVLGLHIRGSCAGCGRLRG